MGIIILFCHFRKIFDNGIKLGLFFLFRHLLMKHCGKGIHLSGKAFFVRIALL